MPQLVVNLRRNSKIVKKVMEKLAYLPLDILS